MEILWLSVTFNNLKNWRSLAIITNAAVSISTFEILIPKQDISKQSSLRSRPRLPVICKEKELHLEIYEKMIT